MFTNLGMAPYLIDTPIWRQFIDSQIFHRKWTFYLLLSSSSSFINHACPLINYCQWRNEHFVLNIFTRNQNPKDMHNLYSCITYFNPSLLLAPTFYSILCQIAIKEWAYRFPLFHAELSFFFPMGLRDEFAINEFDWLRHVGTLSFDLGNYKMAILNERKIKFLSPLLVCDDKYISTYISRDESWTIRFL